MPIASFFFSPKGRISRLQFWGGMLAVVALAGAALLLGISGPAPLLYAMFPLIAIGTVSSYILAIKRLHDHNRSGWWTLVFLWLPGVLDRIGDRIPEDSFGWWLVALLALVISLWGLIELGFRRGTRGDNEYGPDPLGKVAVPVTEPQ